MSLDALSETTDLASPTRQPLTDRSIFTWIDNQPLVFPAPFVSEILRVERSQILKLPGYHPVVLGVVHHQGEIVPLIAAHVLFSASRTQGDRFTLFKETLPVIRCSAAADHLVGVGIVVEQVLNQFTPEQISKQQVFQPTDVPRQLWQPHWQVLER